LTCWSLPGCLSLHLHGPRLRQLQVHSRQLHLHLTRRPQSLRDPRQRPPCLQNLNVHSDRCTAAMSPLSNECEPKILYHTYCLKACRPAGCLSCLLSSRTAHHTYNNCIMILLRVISVWIQRELSNFVLFFGIV